MLANQAFLSLVCEVDSGQLLDTARQSAIQLIELLHVHRLHKLMKRTIIVFVLSHLKAYFKIQNAEQLQAIDLADHLDAQCFTSLLIEKQSEEKCCNKEAKSVAIEAIVQWSPAMLEVDAYYCPLEKGEVMRWIKWQEPR